jgi:hypothetical protein
MGFLRKLLGGDADTKEPTAPSVDPAEIEAEERARDLELLREEQGRMDELRLRQLRYADYAWQPPAQGGERRSGDEDSETDPT